MRTDASFGGGEEGDEGPEPRVRAATARQATIIGILEPSVPYPTETEIIANVVSSPHHLSATMVTGRTHRMTELFGRLAPGADLEAARAEIRAVHGSMMKEYPEASVAELFPERDWNLRSAVVREAPGVGAAGRRVILPHVHLEWRFGPGRSSAEARPPDTIRGRSATAPSSP